MLALPSYGLSTITASLLSVVVAKLSELSQVTAWWENSCPSTLPRSHHLSQHRTSPLSRQGWAGYRGGLILPFSATLSCDLIHAGWLARGSGSQAHPDRKNPLTKTTPHQLVEPEFTLQQVQSSPWVSIQPKACTSWHNFVIWSHIDKKYTGMNNEYVCSRNPGIL